MTVVILESSKYESIVGQLQLSQDTKVFIAPTGNIGKVERVIYIADLESGGKKDQMDILRSNPQVEQWLVLSVEANRQSWKSFCAKLPSTAGSVQTFSTMEMLLNAIKAPAIRTDTCLVLHKKEIPDAGELITLLQEWMPGWQFEDAIFEDDPQICFHTTCSRTIVPGHGPSDFMDVSFPENATPVLVISRLEDNVHLSQRPAVLINRVFGNITGLNWSTQMQARNFFMISTAYESFRLRTKEDPNLFNSLAKD